MMKTFATICALLPCIAGCALVETQQNSFVSLHTRVTQHLADSCDCGPIMTNEIDENRYFKVNPQTSEVVDGRLKVHPKPRGLEITVYERQFLNQKEWDRRYASGMNLMSQFMEMAKTNHSIDINHPIDTQTVQRFTGLTNDFGLLELPDWHFQNAGVDVHIQEVDVVYPGFEQDSAEAKKRYRRIVALLRPYHRADTALELTPLQYLDR